MNDKKWKVKTKEGNAYGPADTETIKRWIQENRISSEDYISSSDIEKWEKPAQINEFTSLFNEKKTTFLLPPAQNRTLTTQVVDDAWRILKSNMFPIIGVFLLYIIVIIVANVIPFLGRIASFVITGPLAAGLSWYCLGQIRKRGVGVSALFDGFKVFLPALGAYLLIALFTILGFIALIIPGIILALAFSLSYFFIIDKNMGPWEAMKASFDISKGYRWRILSINALCTLINILGLLCLGVGILVTAPLTTLASAAFYERLITGNIHKSQKQTNIKEILLGGMLPVIVIIGILAAIMMPALGKARYMARRTVCMSNLTVIWHALQMYSIDYNDQFPPKLQLLYPEYINSPSLFWCPSDKDPKPTDINNNEIDGINSARISYQYNTEHSASDSSNIPLVWDNGCGGPLDNHKKGGNVLYSDGDVEWVPKDKWENPAHGENSYPGKR